MFNIYFSCSHLSSPSLLDIWIAVGQKPSLMCTRFFDTTAEGGRDMLALRLFERYFANITVSFEESVLLAAWLTCWITGLIKQDCTEVTSEVKLDILDESSADARKSKTLLWMLWTSSFPSTEINILTIFTHLAFQMPFHQMLSCFF